MQSCPFKIDRGEENYWHSLTHRFPVMSPTSHGAGCFSKWKRQKGISSPALLPCRLFVYLFRSPILSIWNLLPPCCLNGVVTRRIQLLLKWDEQPLRPKILAAVRSEAVTIRLCAAAYWRAQQVFTHSKYKLHAYNASVLRDHYISIILLDWIYRDM